MLSDAAPDLGKGRKRRCHLNATDPCADTNHVQICKPVTCLLLAHTHHKARRQTDKSSCLHQTASPRSGAGGIQGGKRRINRATEEAGREALANTYRTLQVEIKKILNLLQQMQVSKALHKKQH